MKIGQCLEELEHLKTELRALIADYALFVGWGPISEPEYVAVVILEEAGFGGSSSPSCKTLFEQIHTGLFLAS